MGCMTAGFMCVSCHAGVIQLGLYSLWSLFLSGKDCLIPACASCSLSYELTPVLVLDTVGDVSSKANLTVTDYLNLF